jgi:hypothetical protein
MPFQTFPSGELPPLRPLPGADRLIDATGRVRPVGDLPAELATLATRNPGWRVYALTNLGCAFLGRARGATAAFLHAGSAPPATREAVRAELAARLAATGGRQPVRLVFCFQGWDEIDLTRPAELHALIDAFAARHTRAYARAETAIDRADDDPLATWLYETLEETGGVYTDRLARRLADRGLADTLNLVAPDGRLLYFGSELGRLLGRDWTRNLNARLERPPAVADFASRMLADYQAIAARGRPDLQDAAVCFGAHTPALHYRYRRLIAPVILPRASDHAPGTLAVLYKSPAQLIHRILSG